MYMNISSKSYNATRCRSDVITCKTLRWWRDTVEIQTNLTCEIGLRKELVCERALRPVAPRLMKYASYCALVPIILLMVKRTVGFIFLILTRALLQSCF